MTIESQSDFAKRHGVSRKTVTKWKERGWLAMQGSAVNVEETNALLERYRERPDPRAKKTGALGDKRALDRERGATKRRITAVCKPDGTAEVTFSDDSIRLVFRGKALSGTGGDGKPFDIAAAYYCLQTLQYLLTNQGQPVPAHLEPVLPPLALPHGTPETIAAYDAA